MVFPARFGSAALTGALAGLGPGLLVPAAHGFHDDVFPTALDALGFGPDAVVKGKLPVGPADDLVSRLLAFEFAAHRMDDLPAAQKEDAAFRAARDLQAARAFAHATHLDDVHEIKLVELAGEPLFADEMPQLGRL